MLSGCFSKEEIKKSEVDERIEKNDILKNDLANKYNAIIFDDQSFYFSKEIQDNFDKNFLLRGSVSDIYEKDGKFLIKISDGYYYGIFEINSEQLNFIKDDANKDDLFDLLNDFFIVVKIDDVSKPIFKIDGEIDVDTIQINTSSSDSFLLRGILIDIKKID
jgi:hypothetical protein